MSCPTRLAAATSFCVTLSLDDSDPQTDDSFANIAASLDTHGHQPPAVNCVKKSSLVRFLTAAVTLS